MLTSLLLFGWLHLLLLTILFPLVAPYLVARQLIRNPPVGGATAALIGQMLRQMCIVAVLLPLWPFVGIYMLCRWAADCACAPRAPPAGWDTQSLDDALPSSFMQARPVTAILCPLLVTASLPAAHPRFPSDATRVRASAEGAPLQPTPCTASVEQALVHVCCPASALGRSTSKEA